MEKDILPVEQKALRKGRRGCYDALMVDAMVMEYAQDNHFDLSVASSDLFVDRTSETTGMTMGLRKCAVVHMRKGKSRGGVDLSSQGT